MRGTILLSAIFTLSVSASAADAPPVPYPDGYRHWTHVKSMVINPGHPLHGTFGGIHHLYANKKAMTGYLDGKFPNGSVIVFDLLETIGADNALTEGPRKVVGVMLKDSRRFAATGGWGFEGFAGDGRERVVGNKAAAACYQCHTVQKDNGYVFSHWRP